MDTYTSKPHGNLFGLMPLGAMPKVFPGPGTVDPWDGAIFGHEDGNILVTKERGEAL